MTKVVEQARLLLVAASVVACGSGGEWEEPDAPAVAVHQEPIQNGALTSGAVGIVDFTLPDPADGPPPVPLSCTGTMIASGVILTAAHCFKLGLENLAPDQTTGQFPTKVSYYDPESGRRTVFDSATDGLATWKARNYVYEADFPGDANDDIGVVIVPGFRGTDYRDYKRLYDDVAGPLGDTGPFGATVLLRAYGAGIFEPNGAHDDNLRRADFEVESVSPEHIVTDNEGPRTCGGDSGGPLIRFANTGHPGQLELVAAVLALHEGNPDSSYCAAGSGSAVITHPTLIPPVTWVGDNSGWCRVQTHLSWLQNATGLTCEQLLPPGVQFQYRRCFKLPFIEDVGYEGTISQGKATAIVVAAVL